MLAVVRPDAWNLPLFLHILGATTLFGATLAVAVLASAAGRSAAREQLARASFGTLLLVAVPGWVALNAAGEWTKSKEALPDGVNWVEVPRAIGSVGIVAILAMTGVAFSWKRKPESGGRPRALQIVAALYIAALAVAWWVMTAKPGL